MPLLRVRDTFLLFRHPDSAASFSFRTAGPNSNGSQFFICTGETPWLNGKHVVFGKVTSGYDVVQRMGSLGTEFGKPTGEVVITGCGAV